VFIDIMEKYEGNERKPLTHKKKSGAVDWSRIMDEPKRQMKKEGEWITP